MLLMQTRRTAKQGRQNKHSLSQIFVRIKGLQVALCHLQDVNGQTHPYASHFCAISARFLSTVSKKTALYLHFEQITESKNKKRLRSEGTLRIIYFQTPCCGLGYHPRYQVSQGPIKSGLEHIQR